MADPDIRQLERTKSVRFRPWIGEDYGKGNELGLPARLLILGESHYNWTFAKSPVQDNRARTWGSTDLTDLSIFI